MEKIVVEIENKVEVFDFKIKGITFEDFTQVDTWESFIKYKDGEGRVIIAFKSLDPVQAAFTEIMGEGFSPSPAIVLISASPSILQEIDSY